jgi:hypothetical protein
MKNCLKKCLAVQSTAHQTIQFGLCTALISRSLTLISNYNCIVHVMLIVIIIVIIISLLIPRLLRHRPSLWITHKKNGPWPTTWAQCGLVGANDCKSSRDQRLNMPSEARRSSRYYNFGHPSNDRPKLLNFRDRSPKRTYRRPSSPVDRTSWK